MPPPDQTSARSAADPAFVDSSFGHLLKQRVGVVIGAADVGVCHRRREHHRLRHALPVQAPRQNRFHALITVDRKSTRLNSSHLVISYAVFCLKKKKIYYKTNDIYIRLSD